MAYETLWSLSYEVWFYIIMCAVGYTIVRRNSGKAVWGFLTFGICALVFTKLQAYFLFIWFIGALGYFLLEKKSKAALAALAILSIVMVGVMQLTSGSNTNTQFGEIAELRTFIEITFGLTICGFIIQIIQFPPKSKIGESINTLGTRLAAFSYTLYLTHIPVRNLLIHFKAPKCASIDLTSISLYLCWIAIAMATAYAFYYLFERNTRKVKTWIKDRILHSASNTNPVNS